MIKCDPRRDDDMTYESWSDSLGNFRRFRGPELRFSAVERCSFSGSIQARILTLEL